MAKAWSWSFSKLKNFETCEYRHEQIDLKRSVVEPIEPGGPLDWGNQVHKSMEDCLNGAAELPVVMKEYQKWVDYVRAWPGKLLVEQKYAINDKFEATPYFGGNAWYRCRGDVVAIGEKVAFVGDWKTGKVPDEPISPQLMLMAQCLFSHFPTLKRVGSMFIWLQEDTTTPVMYTREAVRDQWPELLERVHLMRQAFANQRYRKQPSGLCVNHCPVKSCEFYKKGNR